MARELIYTSFPKGVKPGVSGFCTVAVSPDLAPNMISRLEGLSGYRHLYMPGTPEAEFNPPNWSHVVISVGNTESHVVYRVADAGLDYTGRSNKLAHFIVLDKNDLAPCGPAAMLTTPGLIDVAFDQQVGTRPFTRPIPRQLVSPRPCLAWRQAAGDAGWAGELAQTAWTGKYACIVYRPGMNVLALIQEAMALLPPERRWKTTFSTYYSKLPTGIDCQWRCVAAGTPEADQAIAEVGAGLVIDLSNGALAPAADSPAVTAARAGRMVLAPVAKSGGTAARPRPVQPSLSAVEAEVNAGILDELQAIDSTSLIDSEEELMNAMDSMPEFTLNSQRKKKHQAGAGKKIGLFAAILAVVFLIGIAVATYCVVTTESTQNGNNTVAVNQTNPDEDDEDQTTDETTNETDDEQFGVIPDPDQSAVNDPNSEPAPVTEPAPVSDQNQQQDGNGVNGSDKGENQPKGEIQPEQQNANTDQNAASVQSEAAVPESEPKADSKQQEEEKKNAEPAKQKKEPENQQNDEANVFNDSRWVEADRNQYFIFVDSNGAADCSRLNYQLKEKKLQISNLELISIYKTDNSDMDEYELVYKKEFSCYVVKINSVDSSIMIRTSQNSQGDNQKPDNFSTVSIEGDGGLEFSDFVKQKFLLATFPDNSTKVIGFFQRIADNNLKTALNQATFENSFNTAIYTVQASGFAEGLSISDLKYGCYGKFVSVNKKEYEIVSREFNKRNSSYEIRIKFKETLKKPEGGLGDVHDKAQQKNSAPANPSAGTINNTNTVSNTDTINNIVIAFEQDSKSIKIRKVKYAFDLESKRSGEPTGIDVIVKEYFGSTPKAKQAFLKNKRQFGFNLPLFIDVYIFNPLAPNATHEPFLWKRIVLPQPEGASK